jgi:squalene-hopene/tetraprenyl-beta-curcumene cyclase
LQNRNGGWPTFCRGWGKLPFDRSGADLTAHAIRALHAWSDLCDARREIQRGLKYLARVQRPDGSWTPLWFGNQDHPRDENPVYGTAKVLLAYRDLEMLETPVAERGLAWLQAAQNADGGWGGGPAVGTAIGSGTGEPVSSIEETAVAIEALLAWPALQRWSVAAAGEPPHPAVMGLVKGLDWLVTAVEQDRFRHPSPIGFYFAKLWYHEKLYPIIFTASALGRAIRGWAGTADSGGSTSHLVSVAAETPPFSDRTEAKRKLAPHGKDVPVSGVRGIQQPCP